MKGIRLGSLSSNWPHVPVCCLRASLCVQVRGGERSGSAGFVSLSGLTGRKGENGGVTHLTLAPCDRICEYPRGTDTCSKNICLVKIQTHQPHEFRTVITIATGSMVSLQKSPGIFNMHVVGGWGRPCQFKHPGEADIAYVSGTKNLVQLEWMVRTWGGPPAGVT